MGSTNKTTNYELSQYIGTDKPSWLNDYNNDMLKIDTQMKANATAAGNAQTTANLADGKADANTLAIGTLDNQINAPSTGLAATVADHTTAITVINGTIGTTPLTTVAQTLTGAIEEVKGSIPSITGLLKYIGVKRFSVSADGVKSYEMLCNEVHSQLLTYLATKTSSYRFQTVACTPDSDSIGEYFGRNQAMMHDKNFTGAVVGYRTQNTTIYIVAMLTSGSYTRNISIDSGTETNTSSTVPTTGAAWLDIQEYEIV